MKRFFVLIPVLSALCVASCSHPSPSVFTLEQGREGELESFVENLQERDTVLIADQLRYGAFLGGIPDGSQIGLPVGDVAPGMEMISKWELDTVATYERDSLMDIKASMVVTSFDQGEYMLPPFRIAVQLRDGSIDTLSFSGQDVLVCETPVDTATFVSAQLKEQRTIPVQAREWLPYVGGGLFILAFFVFACWFFIRRMSRQKGTVYRDPPYIVALRKLDNFRGSQHWDTDVQKSFYSGVTDILREYISKRYGISAMEMTTSEIMKSLKKEDIPADLRDSLKELLEDADFVKFAKVLYEDERNARVIPFGVQFVMTTYRQQLEQEQKEQQRKQEMARGQGKKVRRRQ